MISSDELLDSEPIEIRVSSNDDDDDQDLTLGSSQGDVGWNSFNSTNGTINNIVDIGESVKTPPSPRTNADLAVEYFLKSLSDREGYLKNINVSLNSSSKAEKELIRFCKNVTKSAENISENNAGCNESLPRSPKCSCMMHSTDMSESASTQVLWEVQGASNAAASAIASTSSPSQPGQSLDRSNNAMDEVFGKLRKSPTDGSLCFDPKNKGRISSMSWNMSVSLDTLSKKSTSAFTRLTKSEGKKRRRGSHARDKGHKTWLDWQLF